MTGIASFWLSFSYWMFTFYKWASRDLTLVQITNTIGRSRGNSNKLLSA
jgi:hypothetical protein